MIEAQVIGKTERGPVEILRQIGRAVAQDDVAFTKAQMGKKIIDIGNTLKRAAHDDDVTL